MELTLERKGTAESIQLFHGSGELFDEFSLDYLGKHGTAQGRGIYLTPNPNMAEMYSWKEGELGYLYQVEVALEKELSLDKITVSEEELGQIIDILHKKNDFLSNINDIDYYGEKMVRREAIASFLDNDESDVDLINDLESVCGDYEAVVEAFYEVGGYTHLVAENQLSQQDQVVVVFDPQAITIQKVQNIGVEIDVPAVTADPFKDEEEELFDRQMENYKEFWAKRLQEERAFSITGYKEDGSETVKTLFTKSPNKEYAYQLTNFDKDGLPYSHYDITREELDLAQNMQSREILSRLPYSTENVTCIVEYPQREEQVHQLAKNLSREQAELYLVENSLEFAQNVDRVYQSDGRPRDQVTEIIYKQSCERERLRDQLTPEEIQQVDQLRESKLTEREINRIAKKENTPAFDSTEECIEHLVMKNSKMMVDVTTDRGTKERPEDTLEASVIKTAGKYIGEISSTLGTNENSAMAWSKAVSRAETETIQGFEKDSFKALEFYQQHDHEIRKETDKISRLLGIERKNSLGYLPENDPGENLVVQKTNACITAFRSASLTIKNDLNKKMTFDSPFNTKETKSIVEQKKKQGMEL